MDQYVIVDLEMCNVPKNNRTKRFRWSNELIQIGAVLVDEDLEIIDKFMTYVKPEFGRLDSHIEQLTGIKEHNLTNAPTAEEALEAFFTWVPDGAILVSWSENDEIQIRRELKGKDIQISNIEDKLEGWIDCQKMFSDKLNSPRRYRLLEALNIAAVDYKEQQHDGLIDAYNTALLFVKMERENVLQVSTYYLELQQLSEDFYTPFADIFSQRKVLLT